MKSLIAILAALALSASAIADENPSRVYQQGGAVVPADGSSVVIDGLSSVAINANFQLPAEHLLLELQPSETTDMISVSSTGSRPIFTDAAVSQADIVTSEAGHYSHIEALHRDSLGLGTDNYVVTGDLTVNDRRFARLILLPCTVTDDTVMFAAEHTIHVGERVVRSHELLPPDEILLRQTPAAAQTTGPDYVIITDEALAPAFETLRRYRRATGYQSEIVTLEEIDFRYVGADRAERLRNYLKDFYADGGHYVLLGGDETVVPVRYAYHFNTSAVPPLADQQICDLYYADLTGDWDQDNDGVYGEPYYDAPDLQPELYVGRLPVATEAEVTAYTQNLITYETDPGHGDPRYLHDIFFFSSDQMRDGNQHGFIGQVFPDDMRLDTVSGVEASSGADPAPTNDIAADVTDVVRGKYGIVNVIAHGRSDGFAVTSSGYNDWPKSYLLTEPENGGHGSFDSLTSADFPAFYYSLACESGAFDMDAPPFESSDINMAQRLLGSTGGAVAMVAYSRWGWVGTSHHVQRAFFEYLFAHPNEPAIEAMHAAKQEFYYLRDCNYGRNWLGDPALRVHTKIPYRPEVETIIAPNSIMVQLQSEVQLPTAARVTIADSNAVLATASFDDYGEAELMTALDPGATYTLTVSGAGLLVTQLQLTGSIVTNVDDENASLPQDFELAQNYPNPFNPSTTIAFSLPRAGHISLVIYNILGERVTTLISNQLPAGRHEVIWDGTTALGSPVASGIYFYRLQADAFTAVRKMALLK